MTDRAIASAETDLVEQAYEVLSRVPRHESAPLGHPEVQAFMSLSEAHRDTMRRVARVWFALGSVTELPWPSADELDNDVEPDVETAATPVRVGTLRRSLLRWAAGVAAIAMTAWAGLAVFDGGSSASYETLAGGHRTIELSDGSQVHLGARTRMAVNFSRKERELTLETGEAFFEVASDAQRPFTVHAGASSTTAIGTAFNIRHMPSRTIVSVTEGRVVLGMSGAALEPMNLAAGEQITIDSGATGSIVRRDVGEMTAWRNGRFIYVAEPLSTVIEDLSRYSPQPLVFVGDASVQLDYTGVVTRDHLEDWLAALEAAFPVSIERDRDRIVVRERVR